MVGRELVDPPDLEVITHVLNLPKVHFAKVSYNKSGAWPKGCQGGGEGGSSQFLGSPRAQGQDITYVTERCIMRLTVDGLLVTEITSGMDLHRDILTQAPTPLRLTENIKTMGRWLFLEPLFGLAL